jgi:hypothetical protein
MQEAFGLVIRLGPRDSALAPVVGERDEEIRQMLEARNARSVRQGTPLDVEAEVARRLRELAD